ncbi:putative cinnamoyl-CoA reductase [Arabidopsis thaliana]|jgi:nucleoside-diphosphate-sugar epimerase|uniref:CRL2 n=3 Tax=Arabidopsis TaxID=3701 RepID=A0A178VVW0_ARATH|nr:NAD(P)-binding Rossmann-fold superfamily protein [Arabidopsis thaliana]KAG7642986.1 NAD-dependent epimerase/dehydratase [Arabidopsis suecica]AAB80683.1 putative cinnamoyl-CoA reductase [Arabidopsis thaliana]AAM13142.1 putative cinnamoyl-CoA reductase [Arabidopsis thaliana]AAP42731.1 At2g33600 [Arabidopsis thaliana]AEC08858.1 NAD(P)-binding Rossmann-fold superfamily protein [Arabidopsis thaliana]|eukprot:NP_180918.1 NAD(P)-binding Rossmann-fold superfamily protein [Arabidopsis thaliana]
MAVVQKGKVCVTGAGGFLGSWVVNHLLSRDYFVHGTVRDPGNEKYAHLKKLDKAGDKLKLFKADLLNYGSLQSAIAGCSGVFHVACPVPSASVPNPEVDLIAPAVDGTLNVLKACVEAKVKRVVYVSSVSAVAMNPMWSKSQVLDETAWSDQDYCKKTENWYSLSKTRAESEAFEFAKRTGLDLVSVCPTLVLGPVLQQHTVNASSLVLLKLLKEGYESRNNQERHLVDVRDVAQALLLVYEKAEAEGRYICIGHTVREQEVAEKLKSLYLNYNYPKRYIEADGKVKVSSEKLQKLGWTYRPLEETLVDSVESYRKAKLVD